MTLGNIIFGYRSARTFLTFSKDCDLGPNDHSCHLPPEQGIHLVCWYLVDMTANASLAPMTESCSTPQKTCPQLKADQVHVGMTTDS